MVNNESYSFLLNYQFEESAILAESRLERSRLSSGSGYSRNSVRTTRFRLPDIKVKNKDAVSMIIDNDQYRRNSL